jgi:hypothetical protein
VHEPFTAPAKAEEMNLDWYFALVYGGSRTLADVAWEAPGRSAALEPGPGRLLFLRLEPDESGTCTVSFGGEPRAFPLRAGVPLSLRLELERLGPGPRLAVTPAAAIREARLFR